MTMTLDDPRYPEFLDRLAGPEGCNLRDNGGTDCSHGTDTRHTQAILRDMGLNTAEIKSSLAYFSARGGFCDCEIVLNVNPTDIDNQEAQHGTD